MIGKFDKALTLINKSIEQAKLNQNQPNPSTLLLKAEVLIFNSQIDEALSIVKDLYKTTDSDQHKINSIALLMTIDNILGNISDSLDLYKEFNEILENKGKLNEEFLFEAKSKISKEVARTYFFKGEFDLSIQFYQDSLSWAEQISNFYIMGKSANGIAGCYYRKGELDKSKSYMLKSNSYFEKRDDYYNLALNKNNVGLICLREGNLLEGIKNLNQALEFNLKIGNLEHIAANNNNLGEIYSEMGELERALDYYKLALSIREENNLQIHIPYVQSSIGTIYYEMNDLDKAIYFLELALKSYQTNGSEKLVAKTIFSLIRVNLQKNNREKCNRLLEQLAKLAKTLEDKLTDQILKMAKAMLSRQGKRLKDLVKSQDLFREVIEDEVTDQSLTLLAMINYCELLIMETNILDQVDSLDEILKIFETIYNHTKNNNLFALNVRSLILQSRFAMIKNDYQLVDSLLDQALLLTNEKNLNTLKKEVLSEKRRFEEFREKWQKTAIQVMNFSTLESEVELTEYLNLIAKFMKADQNE